MQFSSLGTSFILVVPQMQVKNENASLGRDNSCGVNSVNCGQLLHNSEDDLSFYKQVFILISNSQT